MSAKISVEASEVWEYFLKHKEELLLSMHEIASNNEFGIVIYVTEDDGLPSIVVCADDEEIFDETTSDAADCRKTAEKIYHDYLTSNVISILSGDVAETEDDYSQFELETQIEERETELDEALYMYLSTVLEDDYSIDCCLDEEMLEDVKEHFLEYLARKWNIPIRRPMFLEDEDGEDFFEEYPYEYMIFEDEDNPTYE